MASILNYGAEAQKHKKYRTDALVDAAMTDAHRAYITDLSQMTFSKIDSISMSLFNPQITWVGKTLLLDSKVGVKMVFNASNYTSDVSKLSMRVSYTNYNGEAKTITVTNLEVYSASKNYYSFTFSDLLAAELRSVLSIAIYEGDNLLSDTLEYSAETYAANSVGATVGTLSGSLFAYSDAAKAYFVK